MVDDGTKAETGSRLCCLWRQRMRFEERLEDRMHQHMKTGKICYILELFESTPKELWLLLWKWGNNIHETEAPRTTLSGFERVRAFTFWSVDKRGTTEPAMAAAKNHPKSLQFIWYNCLNVIKTVISPDNKGNLEIVLKRLPFRCDLGP